MRRLLAVTTLIVAMLATATPAFAGPPGGGGGDGQSFYAHVKSLVRVRGSGYKGGGSPNVPVNFDPPHCWYQPQYSYDEMVQFINRVWFTMHHDPDFQREAGAWKTQELDKIKPYAGEAGKVFWFLTDDNTDAGWACYTSTNPFWIHVGAQPPAVPNDKIIDPTDLARIARANLRLPKPKITLNPPGQKSFVGLETWVGVDDPQQLFVEAFVAGVPNLFARIDAVPSTVTIDVNGADATVHDGRATCPAYRKGLAKASGCWVRFNRSSLGAPYTITVTRRWTVTTNVAGVFMPPGIVQATTTVVVDEIQSNVVH
jgi:hypothetical protein